MSIEDMILSIYNLGYDDGAQGQVARRNLARSESEILELALREAGWAVKRGLDLHIADSEAEAREWADPENCADEVEVVRIYVETQAEEPT